MICDSCVHVCKATHGRKECTLYDKDECYCEKCKTHNHCPCEHCLANGFTRIQHTTWKWTENGNVATCGNCGKYLFS